MVLQYLFILFPFIILSLRQESQAGKQCPFHQSNKAAAAPKESPCGKLSFYYYGEISPYAGAFGADCSVALSDLTGAFRLAFPAAVDTRFLTHAGLPFDALLVAAGNETMVVALDRGDQFVWPVLKAWEPFTVDVQGSQVTLTPVSASPRILLIDNIFTEEHLLAVAKEQKASMARSTVGDNAGKRVLETRTSRHTWIGHSRNPDHPNAFYTDAIVARVERKLFEIGRSPLNGTLAEAMQCVFYDETQHYFLHRDYAEPGDEKENPYHVGGGNRFITLLLYLNDVAKGGETLFPYLSEQGEPVHRERLGELDRWEQDLCEVGDVLRVVPKKGRVVMFYSMHERNNYVNKDQSALDPYSLHMGCPVIEGEKYVVNVWLRNKEVDGKLYNAYE